MLAYLFTGGIDTGGFCFALVCRFAQLGAGGLYAINPRSSANIKRSSAGRLPQPIASNPRYAAIIGSRCNVAALYSRSEERRGGKECVSTGRSRWSPVH